VSLNQEALVDQIDVVVEQARQLIARSKYDDSSDQPRMIVSEVVSRMFATIERLAPPNSRYRENAKALDTHFLNSPGRALGPLAGILQALRSDLESGYLQSVIELLHADLFADFLEMATYLLQQGYKDPAAVIVGTVLEEQLRKLSQKAGISLELANGAPKKADGLNSELTAAQTYSKLDQKNVTAWLDLRNKAAHGKYAEYSSEQVELMLQGVQNFMSRHPA
jgi:hypothetical protein